MKLFLGLAALHFQLVGLALIGIALGTKVALGVFLVLCGLAIDRRIEAESRCGSSESREARAS